MDEEVNDLAAGHETATPKPLLPPSSLAKRKSLDCASTPFTPIYAVQLPPFGLSW